MRIDYRMAWEDAFRGYLAGLKEKKPVVVCGDMNVARWEIDLKTQNPTGEMPGSLTRSGPRWKNFWHPALWTASAISTRR